MKFDIKQIPLSDKARAQLAELEKAKPYRHTNSSEIIEQAVRLLYEAVVVHDRQLYQGLNDLRRMSELRDFDNGGKGYEPHRITHHRWDYYKRLRAGCHLGHDDSCPYEHCISCPIGKMYRKLQPLEDRAEEGSLIVLPIAMGAPVFFIREEDGVKSCIETVKMDYWCLPLLGTRVFFEKEAADMALEALQTVQQQTGTEKGVTHE